MKRKVNSVIQRLKMPVPYGPRIFGSIRRFIAGTILHNQKVADVVGLHLTDMQCINVLELVGPATPGDLARSTGLTTGGVTVMLDRLEKAGYVKREPNPQDRRSLLVRVNPKSSKKYICTTPRSIGS